MTTRPDRVRLIRHQRGSFDGRFFEQHPGFWPIARAARVFADCIEWPDPEDYGSAFAEQAPVRFASSPDKRKRPRGMPVDRMSLYDAQIVRCGVVPTRRRMWHDFLNALCWATFPRAKLALHTRQHRAVESWIPEGALELPNARTREMDALALVDEGGVIGLQLDDSDDRMLVVFGHAIFEGFVMQQPAMVARFVELRVPREVARSLEASLRAPRSPVQPDPRTELADALLAEKINDGASLLTPLELPRLPLGAIKSFDAPVPASILL